MEKLQTILKLIQFLETPVYNSQVEISDGVNTPAANNFYDGMIVDRGEGGFGSTDGDSEDQPQIEASKPHLIKPKN
jgi:hypothetical protein